jgi:hypothetical protein
MGGNDMKDEIRVVARMDRGKKIRLYHLLLDEGKTFSAWLREQADTYIGAKKVKGAAKKLAAIALLVLLAGCGGYDGPEVAPQVGETVVGYQVTATVPFAHETIQDIIDRENNNPLPPQGDRAMPDHHILSEER